MSDLDWIYDFVFGKITSPLFRNPIKEFIDDNCSFFFDVQENTFQQGALFNQFKQLVENLLQKILQECEISHEMFLLAAKKGLEIEKDKKYFEQLISFDNYDYFKSMMIKRNYQLLHQAEMEMKKTDHKEKGVQSSTTDSKQTKFADKEIDAAIKMSLVIEEEKRRIAAIEDAELRRAIRLSEMDILKNQQRQGIPVYQKPLDVIQPSKVEEEPIKLKEEKPNLTINLASQLDNKSIAPAVIISSTIQSAGKGFGKQLEKYNKDFGIKQNNPKIKEKQEEIPNKVIIKNESIFNPYPNLEKPLLVVEPSVIEKPLENTPMNDDFQEVRIDNETNKTKEVIEQPIKPKEKRMQTIKPIEEEIKDPIKPKEEETKQPIKQSKIKEEILYEKRQENISLNQDNKLESKIIEEKKSKTEKPQSTIIEVESKKPEVEEIIVPLIQPKKEVMIEPQIISLDQEKIEMSDFSIFRDINQQKKELQKEETKKEEARVGEPKNEEPKILQNMIMDNKSTIQKLQRNPNNFLGKEDYKLPKLKDKNQGFFFPQFSQIIDTPKENIISFNDKKFVSVIQEYNDQDLIDKVTDVEKEKEAKLKQYRDSILQMKKEKRKAKEDNLLTKEEEIKQKQQRELAEILKKSNIN